MENTNPHIDKPVWYSFQIFLNDKKKTKTYPNGTPTITHLVMPEGVTQPEALMECLTFWQSYGPVPMPDVKVFVARKRPGQFSDLSAAIVKESIINVPQPAPKGSLVVTGFETGANKQ